MPHKLPFLQKVRRSLQKFHPGNPRFLLFFLFRQPAAQTLCKYESENHLWMFPLLILLSAQHPDFPHPSAVLPAPVLPVPLHHSDLFRHMESAFLLILHMCSDLLLTDHSQHSLYPVRSPEFPALYSLHFQYLLLHHQ